MKPLLKSSWDDGGIDDVRISDLMLKHGIDTTFYIPVLWQRVNTQKGRFSLSLQELQELAKLHTIGSHTITHPFLTSIDINHANNEICESKKMLEDLIGKEVTSFCYPRGYYNEAIKDLVAAAGYLDARTTKVGYISEPDDPYASHTSLHVGYNRKEYEGLNWLDYGLQLYEKSKATPGSVFHLWGHSEEISRLGQWENFEYFLEEIAK